jgi:hypothetical protein
VYEQGLIKTQLQLVLAVQLLTVKFLILLLLNSSMLTRAERLWCINVSLTLFEEMFLGAGMWRILEDHRKSVYIYLICSAILCQIVPVFCHAILPFCLVNCFSNYSAIHTTERAGTFQAVLYFGSVYPAYASL